MSNADNFQLNGQWQEFLVIGSLKAATVAYDLHSKIKMRISNPKYKTYQDCSMSAEFQDFQFFAEWCSKQIGYLNTDDNNKVWQIDKDLLEKGNRVYSFDKCVFIPHVLNSLISKKTSKKSKLPTGVTICSITGAFRVMCTNSLGKSVYLGNYKLLKDAFSVYKKHKEIAIKERALQYKNQLDPRLFHSLMNWQVEIHDC